MISRPRTRRRFVDPWTAGTCLLIAVFVLLSVFVAYYVLRPDGGADAPPVVAVSIADVEHAHRDSPASPDPAGRPDDEPGDVAVREDLATPSAPTLPPVGSVSSDPARVATTRPAGDADPAAPVSKEVASVESSIPTDPYAADDPYANRSDARRATALGVYGGDRETEAAVRAGLRWLAAHQHQSGVWDRLHFDRHCPELDRCRQTAVAAVELDFGPGVTGLVLMAFLGAGRTHEQGEFSDNVLLGITYLLDRQLPDGAFADLDHAQMYNHAIATIALAEAYGMTRDPLFAQPLERAVAFLVRSQQPGGGWDYTADLSTGRNDVSITGWVVMALAGAKAVAVDVPDRTVAGIADFISAATDRQGYTYYADTGTGTVTDNATGTVTRRYGPATTAVAMLIRQMLGWRAGATTLVKQRDLLLGELPDIDLYSGTDRYALHSMYYWYYGSLATFHHGKEAWNIWSPRMRDALFDLQEECANSLGEPRHCAGSWPAFGQRWGNWGRTGGRIYSTALGVLMLETYYRYRPAFLSSSGLLTTSAIRIGLTDESFRNRSAFVTAAVEVSADVGEPILVELLTGNPPVADRMRLRAAIGLVAHGSPLGEQVLRSVLGQMTGGERTVVASALEAIDRMTWPDEYGAVVRVADQQDVIVFKTGGRHAYLGQTLHVIRADSEQWRADRTSDEPASGPIATVRVVRRLRAHDLAAAEVLDTSGPDNPLEVGDIVVP